MDNSNSNSLMLGGDMMMTRSVMATSGKALGYDENGMLHKTVCIGIGGGVGPAAGVMLHRKIIEATVSDGTDQSHCEVHHISRPGVADRTSYLIGESDESPAVGMARTMAALAESAQASGKIKAIAGVPCNTFHAPKIWDEFLEMLQNRGISDTVEVVHMLHETVAAIRRICPDAKRIGLLSTTGTRRSRVYHDLLEPEGFEVVEVEDGTQERVHDAIYNRYWGVKAVQPTTEKARGSFSAFAQDLNAQGADAIILGCTEIPLALSEPWFDGTPLIDPMAVLANALVEKVGAVAADLIQPPAFTPPSVCGTPAATSLTSTLSTSRYPKWQQHAAAFVIQAHWRAHVASKRSCFNNHQEYFRVQLGASPDFTPASSENHGITPELFTPNVAAGMLRVASCDMLMT